MLDTVNAISHLWRVTLGPGVKSTQMTSSLLTRLPFGFASPGTRLSAPELFEARLPLERAFTTFHILDDQVTRP